MRIELLSFAIQGSFPEDPLTVVLRSGAQRLLAQAVEMEVTAFIAAHGDLEDDAGRHRVVRHGHHRERQVQTGIGAGRGALPQGARPRGCGRGRQDPFHLGDPAALPQAGQVDRGARRSVMESPVRVREHIKQDEKGNVIMKEIPPRDVAPGHQGRDVVA